MRNKRRRQAEADLDPEFQIAPMIDILLVLLVFFMSISSTEVLQNKKDVHLPVATVSDRDKTVKNNPSQVVINISAKSEIPTIEIDEQKYASPSEIADMLKKRVMANPLLRIVIRADQETHYEYIKTLLHLIAKMGISNVSFSVLNPSVTPSK